MVRVAPKLIIRNHRANWVQENHQHLVKQPPNSVRVSKTKITYLHNNNSNNQCKLCRPHPWLQWQLRRLLTPTISLSITSARGWHRKTDSSFNKLAARQTILYLLQSEKEAMLMKNCARCNFVYCRKIRKRHRRVFWIPLFHTNILWLHLMNMRLPVRGTDYEILAWSSVIQCTYYINMIDNR